MRPLLSRVRLGRSDVVAEDALHLADELLGLALAFLRRAFVARLGGTTGDTAGALLELGECAVLLALALLV